MAHAGSDWIKSNISKEMSEHGANVANLLGDVFLGIYHLNRTSLGKVEWSNERHIEVTVGRPLATIDGDELTRLVVLGHDRMMRIEISGLAPGYLRLTVYQRRVREGRLWKRCPTLEEHVQKLRDYFGQPEA